MAVEGIYRWTRDGASDKILRAAGVSAILTVGVDCWTAGLLFCDSVLLCCFPVLSWVGFWRVLCAGFPRSYLSAFLVLFCS